ncbi:MAG: sulfatase [Candidatus Wallbacteria bacterium]|nr:sulfatase [Candidatus Wallbacteria bacterium]
MLAGAFALLVAAPALVASPAPDIVMVSVDCLRADHCGCYGYGPKTTPILDAVSRSGVRFESALATANWTLPSVATLLTGLHPSRHAATHSYSPIRDGISTVAEQLRAAGYQTCAIVAITFSAPALGLARGFDFYDTRVPEVFLGYRPILGFVLAARQWMCSMIGNWSPNADCASADAVELARAAADWLRKPAAKPRFLWVHFLDPHYPYENRKPYYAQFHPEPAPKESPDFSIGSDANQVLKSFDEFTPAVRKHALALYDSEVRYTDDGMAILLGGLNRSRTIVLVTGDHGEAFGEHGKLGHGSDMHLEQIRVPLIVSGPSVSAGVVVTEPVSLLDVAPTLLDFARAANPGTMDGGSLVPRFDGDTAGTSRPAFTERQTMLLTEGDYSMVDGGRHVTMHVYPFTKHEPDVAIYDWKTDPGETHNLFDSLPENLALSSRLHSHFARMYRTLGGDVVQGRAASDPGEGPSDDLRKLGYLR